MQCLYAVRDYTRLKEEINNIIYYSPTLDGQPHRNTPSDITGEKAVRIAEYNSKCDAIDNALAQLPPEYRKGVFNNITSGSRYPYDAGEATYRRWKYRFIYSVAENLKLI